MFKYLQLLDVVLKHSFNLYGHKGKIIDISWSENDELVISCSTDKTVIIWDI